MCLLDFIGLSGNFPKCHLDRYLSRAVAYVGHIDS